MTVSRSAVDDLHGLNASATSRSAPWPRFPRGPFAPRPCRGPSPNQIRNVCELFAAANTLEWSTLCLSRPLRESRVTFRSLHFSGREMFPVTVRSSVSEAANAAPPRPHPRPATPHTKCLAGMAIPHLTSVQHNSDQLDLLFYY